MVKKTHDNDRELLIRIDERTAEMKKDIIEVKRKLFGNGQQGICERVEVLETSQNNIKYGIALGFTIMTIIITAAKLFLK